MADRTIKVSDFTGEHIDTEADLISVEVSSYQELGTVVLDARRDEAEALLDAALDAVVLTLRDRDGLSERVVVERKVFDHKFRENPLSVLQQAQRVTPKPRPRAEKVDYSLIENAGQPHRGKATEAEKRMVRDNLAEVNERRAVNGHPPIDPRDPGDAHRYGFNSPEAPRPVPASQT